MSKVAFVGGLLIDGTGAEPVKDSLVLVEDKKIVYAGPKKEYGPDYETHDITGGRVPEIRACELRNDAGVIGAAALESSI